MPKTYCYDYNIIMDIIVIIVYMVFNRKKNIMTASAIYCRVSTSEQQKFGVLLEAQAARCQQYASMSGLNVVEVAIEAESGKDTNRPLLQGIIHKINKKQILHVITLKLDRLSRQTEDALRLAKAFAKRGC